MGRGRGRQNQGQNQGRPTCSHCKKIGHLASNCWSLQGQNQQQRGHQQRGHQQRGHQQQPNTKTCNHCNKAGHIRAECFLLNPALRNKPKGQQQQQQQQGGGKPQCAHCNKLGHTADGCFQLHPELKGQRGKNQQQHQQQEIRCTYCLVPNHDVDSCYLLHPELTNPFLQPQQQPPQWGQPATDGGYSNDDDYNNGPPPARLTQRIRDAEALGLELTPEGIRGHPKVRRIQGWHPARQRYFTLPLYGAAVSRPVCHNPQNPFAQAMPQVAYEAYDAEGDAVMCTCSCPEDFECHLQHWVRRVVEHNRQIRFYDESEEGWGRIMQEGLIDTADMGEIY